MCIAILNTTGQIPDINIKNSWDNNNQGAGILYSLNGALCTFKTYNYPELLKEYKRLRKNKQIKHIVLHFRIATSGHELYTNLHPFNVNDTLGFVHNGIIDGLGDQKYSDTYYFNELLKSFKHDFLKCEASKKLIQNYIGWSKLIFLDKYNNFTIIGEESGKWDGENWYSNDSYQSYNDYVYFGNQKQSKRLGEKENELIRNEYFNSFYTNATPDNLHLLVNYLGLDIKTEKFQLEVENLAYHFSTYDINVMIEKINSEFNEEAESNYNCYIDDIITH